MGMSRISNGCHYNAVRPREVDRSPRGSSRFLMFETWIQNDRTFQRTRKEGHYLLTSTSSSDHVYHRHCIGIESSAKCRKKSQADSTERIKQVAMVQHRLQFSLTGGSLLLRLSMLGKRLELLTFTICSLSFPVAVAASEDNPRLGAGWPFNSLLRRA